MDVRTALRRLLAGTPLDIAGDDGQVVTLRSARAPATPQSGRAIGQGTLAGRVLNTATGEYVRNAEIRVEGTTIVAYSEEGGHVRLANLPAGPSSLPPPIARCDRAGPRSRRGSRRARRV